MDNLAHGSAPVQSLTRKRKADSEECSSPDSSPDSTLDPSATRRCPQNTTERPPAAAAMPRALGDRDHDMLSPWPDASASQSDSATTAGASTSDGPSRPKRPRIEIPQSPSSPRRSRKGRPIGRLPASAIDPLMSRPGHLVETQDTGTISYRPGKGPGPANGTLSRRTRCQPIRRSSSDPVSTASVDPQSPHIPPHSPPINRETLKELDLEAILSNPQLRHDLLFDPGLQFRPTSSRRKREVAENYWLAVVRELECGCTCVTLDGEGKPADRRCICSAFPKPTSRAIIAFPALGNLMTVRVASRIRPLLVELGLTLSTIIEPPVPKGLEQYTPRDPANPQMQQNNAHLELLKSVLDVELIEQEIEHKVFNPAALFEAIGSVIRCHCAPMRDAAVHQMVSLAQSCIPGDPESTANAVRAIRLCFEIMELMKLDVANHQLQALRPYLLKSASSYELRAFQEYRQRGELSLDVTRDWIESAYRDLAANQALHSDPKSFLSSFDKQTRLVQITLATIKATIDLVFDPPPRPSIPFVPAPTPYSSPTLRPSYLLASYPRYPETLYLDYTRLSTLAAEAADHTALYMLLLLYRQLVHSSANSERAKDGVSPDELVNLKKEICSIGPQHLGQYLVPRTLQATRNGSRDTGKESKELATWLHELSAVLLQITRHATNPESRANLTTAEPVPDPQIPPAERKVLEVAHNWVIKHFQRTSPLYALMQERIRKKVTDAVVRVIIPPSPKPSPPDESSPQEPETTDGLEPLMPELNHLAERVAKLVTIHMGVYRPLYLQQGFVSA